MQAARRASASVKVIVIVCAGGSGGGAGSGAQNTDGNRAAWNTVNATSKFSISVYTGDGVAGSTVGHGLGVVPDVILVKNRETDDNWRVFSRNDPTDYLALNWTGDSQDDNTSWHDTAPTSSVFYLGTDTNTNRSGDSFVAYCFAGVDGYSSFGVYRGNGNADGPMVYCGFRPAWIMTKITSTTVTNGGDWTVRDVKRDIDNPSSAALYANDTYAESTTSLTYDIYSNGFKALSSGSDINQSGQTFFYMAFAEFPFKYANAR